MKKSLPLLALLPLAALGRAQSFTEGFNDLGTGGDDFNISALLGRGWAESNLSANASGSGPYANGDSVTEFAAHGGAGYASTNYSVGDGTLSAWLFTPTVTLSNGSTFSFWTRTSSNSATVYPDRLELRLSTGGSSMDVGATATSTGSFTTLLTSVNPNLSNTAGAYPTAWTQYSVTLSGLAPAGVSGRLAFRYYVTNGGPTGINGNYIGIDDAAYTFAPVPEPASLAALGLGTLALLRRRRRKA